MKNQVSIRISPDDLQKVITDVESLNTTLKPLLTSLTVEQRIELPKMGDGTEPFVEKALDYVNSNPEFAPPYVKAEEMAIDFKAVKELLSIYRPLYQLVQQLDDSIMLSGSEAYIGSLAYYNSVKMATRMSAPGAKAIYEDLQQRFRRSPAGSSSGEENL